MFGGTMSTEEFRILLSFVGAMAALAATTKVILTWIKRPRAQGALPPELTERLDRIERAVDVTALEVERIGEGQRFLTRALGERSVADPAHKDQPGRVVTPH
jgi:hypothetical protein